MTALGVIPAHEAGLTGPPSGLDLLPHVLLEPAAEEYHLFGIGVVVRRGHCTPSFSPMRIDRNIGELYTWLHSPSLHKSCIGPRFILDYTRVVTYY